MDIKLNIICPCCKTKPLTVSRADNGKAWIYLHGCSDREWGRMLYDYDRRTDGECIYITDSVSTIQSKIDTRYNQMMQVKALSEF